MQDNISTRFKKAHVIFKNTNHTFSNMYVNIKNTPNILQKALNAKEVTINIRQYANLDVSYKHWSYFYTILVSWAKTNGYKYQISNNETNIYKSIKITADKPIYNELMGEYGPHTFFTKIESLQKDGTFKHINTLSAIWIDIIPCFGVDTDEFYTELIHSKNFHQHLLSSKSLYDIFLADGKYTHICGLESFWCQ